MGQIANQKLLELLFRLKDAGKEEKDFAGLNHLPTEVKLLVVQGQTLVNETKETLQNRNYYFDMTSKKQLKTDCKKVENMIQAVSDGKTDEKTIKKLEVAVICLKTSLEGVMQFFAR